MLQVQNVYITDKNRNEIWGSENSYVEVMVTRHNFDFIFFLIHISHLSCTLIQSLENDISSLRNQLLSVHKRYPGKAAAKLRELL